MKVLVTGATGFLGAHLCGHLLNNGHSVVGTCREQSQFDEASSILKEYSSEKNDITWVSGDLRSPLFWQDNLDGIDVVYHTAGMVSFLKKDESDLIKVNAGITRVLVNELLHHHIPLCHVSSTSVFIKQEGIHKDWPYENPDGERSLYGQSKYLAELEAWRGVEEGIDAVVVNPGIILGYGDWNKGSCKLFKQASQAFPFYTDGVTGFVGVKDVCTACILLIDQKRYNERFLLVEGNYTYGKIQSSMAKGFGVKSPKWQAPRWVGELIAGISGISLLWGGKPLMTKATVKSAYDVSTFDGTRIVQKLDDFSYSPIGEVIASTTSLYKKKSRS